MILPWNYTIGRAYKYPNYSKKYVLERVDKWVYVFTCGHRVTENVFGDLIDTATGVQVYKDTQLKLHI